MEIIPVLDVKSRLVVAARGGERAHYQPIASQLVGGCTEPIAVLSKYFSLFPFRKIYVADLDGIEGFEPNQKLLNEISVTFPGIAVWADTGKVDFDQIMRLVTISPMIRPVIGSEMGITSPELARLTSHLNGQLALSLDFRGDVFQGDPSLFAISETWPLNVIVMTLARVGSERGPDIAKISKVMAQAGARAVYAAGGVRDLDDLRVLARAGCAGALIATALHNGKIKTGDLEEATGF